MKKIISVLLYTALLTVVLLASASTARGQTDEVSISFRVHASGECLVGYGNSGPGHPDPYAWFGVGRGDIGGSGQAQAVPLEGTYLDLLGDCYFAESVEARFHLLLNWREDGETHVLVARLYSDSSTGLSVFVPDADCFSVPIGGHPDSPVKALRFEATLLSNSKVQRISGLALVMAWPLGFSPVQPPTSIVCIEAILLDEDSGQMYIAAWLNESCEIPIADPGSPTISVPAAKVFQRAVEIIG